jgi:non-ribosomal peptide synthetase component F
MITSMLAVLKAGGAYVPLDINAPLERIAEMMEDAGLGVVLTQGGLSGRLPGGWVRVIEVDEEREEIREESEDEVEGEVEGERVAYVIYTSGSTGQPKGVMVQHRSVVCDLHVRLDGAAQGSDGAASLRRQYHFSRP